MLVRSLFNLLRRLRGKSLDFTSSTYWEQRYAQGGTSGPGSYGKLAEYKGSVINSFTKEYAVDTVIEFGSGDGNQLQYFGFQSYLGLDVSKSAIERCRETYDVNSGKRFELMTDFDQQHADLVLSLDVIYHLVEDHVFHEYMKSVFKAADRYVIIYSTNKDDDSWSGGHVRHRKFTTWIETNAKDFRWMDTVRNSFPFDGDIETSTSSDFFFFEKS